MNNILENCHKQLIDCLWYYSGNIRYEPYTVEFMETRENGPITYKAVMELLNLIDPRFEDLIFDGSPIMEKFQIKYGIISIILEKKALTHKKFCKIVPKICFAYKPEFTSEDFVYSVLKVLNPKWEVENEFKK